jgi:BirA family biotin operon repressor/biotin-[acetyl-CoA-carboxylase] ligase
MTPARVPALALVAALDWARFLKADFGVDAGVKWPNDVWFNGKKLAGVLAEMSSEVDRIHWLVLGVGVNANNAPPSKGLVPAVSLRGILGRNISRRELLAGWLRRFRKSYSVYQREGFLPFRSAYTDFAVLNGRRISLDAESRDVSGIVRGVDDEGRLMVQTADGPVVLAGGEIHLSVERR